MYTRSEPVRLARPLAGREDRLEGTQPAASATRDVAFTMKQYVQTDLEADRQVANTLAELIIASSTSQA